MHRALLISIIILLVGCSSRSDVVTYANVDEQYLDISGEVAEPLNFKIKVQYVALSEAKECKDYNFLAGLYISKFKDYDYYPKIEGDNHNLHIPLKELSPDTRCNWEPKTVFLCVGDKATEPSKCSSLLAIGTQQDGNDIINIECAISNWCIRTPFGLYTERINKLNRHYVVNIAVKMPNKRLWRK
jgi:hypothetical protein